MPTYLVGEALTEWMAIRLLAPMSLWAEGGCQ
jgi:hypothetical protein